MPLCGGLASAKPASPEVQAICDSVKVEVEQKSGKNCSTFTAIEYKTQVVAGTNYFIKIHVGGEEYLHVRVYQTLPHAGATLTLSDCQIDKNKHDELTYF
ncbi:hypothetical protein FKM82_030066 [Ascaphus truei]|uniref:cystatin-B-like n=1 Tax=Ascaphus truei TaxID=8439 RepID=UPI003F59B897